MSALALGQGYMPPDVCVNPVTVGASFVIGTGHSVARVGLKREYNKLVSTSIRVGLTGITEPCYIARIELRRHASMVLFRYGPPQQVSWKNLTFDGRWSNLPHGNTMWTANDVLLLGGLQMYNSVLWLQVEKPPGPFTLTVWYHSVTDEQPAFSETSDYSAMPKGLSSRSMSWPQPGNLADENEPNRERAEKTE